MGTIFRMILIPFQMNILQFLLKVGTNSKPSLQARNLIN